MCGIVGAISKYNNGFTFYDVSIFEQLLYIDALRGEDSTGIATFHIDGSMEIHKDIKTSGLFLEDKQIQSHLKNLPTTGKAVIGHNRKATVGGSNLEAAHPFIIQNKHLFVHNGTLTNHFQLKFKLKELLESIKAPKQEPSTNVDSEVLGILLASCNGEVSKIETILAEVQGAYACVWIDQEKETLYMTRNAQRPLWVAKTGDGFLYASEPGFIYTTCSRNNTKVLECFEIKTDHLYSFNLDSSELTMAVKELTIKKAIPPQKPILLGDGNTKVSKNAFKRFYKKFIGCNITFFIEDFIERTPGKKREDGWHVWGTNTTLFNIPHLCRSVVFNATESEMMTDWAGEYVGGRVSAITQDASSGEPVLTIVGLKKIPKSFH